ncbi:hypothetical protein ABW21_db0204654 [Orbilia brochopaga]|nr:hypothetical protein ABW21_db0204654 [Drechslerella brochopaga]
MSLCALLARPVTFVPESLSSKLPGFEAGLDHGPLGLSHPFAPPDSFHLASTTMPSPKSDNRNRLSNTSSLSTQRQLKRTVADAGLEFSGRPTKKQIIDSIPSIRAATNKPIAPSLNPSGSALRAAKTSEKIKQRPVPARGYLNKSGTHCYRNASLQALGGIREFRNIVLDHTCNSAKNCVCCPLQKVFRLHYRSDGTRYPPHEPPQLRTIAGSIGGTFDPAKHQKQEDAHEYIALLLDRLSKGGSER